MIIAEAFSARFGTLLRWALASIIAPIILPALLALSSCGSARDSEGGAPHAAADNQTLPSEADWNYGDGLGGGGVAEMLGSPMGGAKSAREGASVSAKRMVAYSMSLMLTVKDVDETRTALVEGVKRSGGFVVEESTNYVAARIPPAGADGFISTAKALGKTEGESKTGTDITDQYRDNIIRLDNARNVRQRYIALLEKAHTVNEILSIERELQRVNLEIEVLEGRIKYAEQSVEYSYVRVSFREKTRPGPLGWVFYGLYRGVKWLFVW